jgi:protein-S-isoprenylcysteine O-methyltransferase Ste14
VQGSLVARSIGGLAQLLVTIAALLCVSSWSLTWSEGWIFVAVFGTAVALITFYFLEKDPALIDRRLQVGPRAEKSRTQKVIQSAASVLFAALFVVPGLDHHFGWSSLPRWASIAGNGLVVAGLLIVFFVFRENSYTAAVIDVGTDQTVISTGPYAIVRHPMYAGALVMIAGIPLALRSAWALLACLPMLIVIVWRLTDEEAYLAEHLAGYRQYREKTRYRLIPWVF